MTLTGFEISILKRMKWAYIMGILIPNKRFHRYLGVNGGLCGYLCRHSGVYHDTHYHILTKVFEVGVPKECFKPGGRLYNILYRRPMSTLEAVQGNGYWWKYGKKLPRLIAIIKTLKYIKNEAN